MRTLEDTIRKSLKLANKEFISGMNASCVVCQKNMRKDWLARGRVGSWRSECGNSLCGGGIIDITLVVKCPVHNTKCIESFATSLLLIVGP